ncbi:MAG: hypothetical protein P8I94_11610 [Emcibacteraceae bacterium]|nr:hypothetical protein [Emcibacteraceae bacterium]
MSCDACDEKLQKHGERLAILEQKVEVNEGIMTEYQLEQGKRTDEVLLALNNNTQAINAMSEKNEDIFKVYEKGANIVDAANSIQKGAIWLAKWGVVWGVVLAGINWASAHLPNPFK